MPLLLLPRTQQEINVAITFVDQTGLNPVPAGQYVTIYRAGLLLIPANVSAAGYIGIGGAFTCTLLSTANYIAVFTGNESPQGYISFSTPGFAGPLTVDPTAYASPTLSQIGFANAQAALWPNDWFNDPARAEGGNAYRIAMAVGALLLSCSIELQQVFVAERLDSSTNANVDSWIADFFGAALPRNTGELDSTYIARATTILSAQLSLRPGIIAVGGLYGVTYVDEPWRPLEVGGWDLGLFAYDVAGGWGTYTPEIDVFVKPVGTLTSAQQAQMKALLLSSKPIGVELNVYLLNSSNVFTQL
jgi:hypothetical protein